MADEYDARAWGGGIGRRIQNAIAAAAAAGLVVLIIAMLACGVFLIAVFGGLAGPWGR